MEKTIPWEVVEKKLSEHGKGRGWLYEEFYYSPNRVTNWIARGVPKGKVVDIAERLGLSADELLFYKKKKLTIVPKKNVIETEHYEIEGQLDSITLRDLRGPGGSSDVPFTTWDKFSHMTELTKESFSAFVNDPKIPSCPDAHSQLTLAMRVTGKSMEGTSAPSFFEGEVVYVDTAKPPKHGDFVTVKLNEAAPEAILRQLLIEGGRSYLLALNPRWPNQTTELPPQAKICGVVIGKYTSMNDFK